MLNISNNPVKVDLSNKNYSALRNVELKKTSKVLKRLMTGTLVICIIVAFIPWTQNIQSAGSVITLRPDQRPQTIHSVIGGQIQMWYVQEGDFVRKGDTIVRLTEIKDAYFDPQLLERTKDQMELKEQTAMSYEDKMNALESQSSDLNKLRKISLEQAELVYQQTKLKVERDSLAYLTAKINFETAKVQYDRTNKLFSEGLKSKTELEDKNLKQEQTKAYELEARNKWLTSKSELINARIQLSNINSKFSADISKVNSEKYTAMSSMYDSRAAINKLQNQFANYSIRNGMYIITAPQDGYITKTMKNGIGETIKEGTPLLSIMPANYDLAIEMYVQPIDLPLIKKGQHVRIQFDGWPAIVFSGWPKSSYGTFGGRVYAVDKFITKGGKFRVLVEPDPRSEPWPEDIRFGSGTHNMLLLKDVPIWYELWRKINGFPPNYYSEADLQKDLKNESK